MIIENCSLANSNIYLQQVRGVAGTGKSKEKLCKREREREREKERTTGILCRTHPALAGATLRLDVLLSFFLVLWWRLC